MNLRTYSRVVAGLVLLGLAATAPAQSRRREEAPVSPIETGFRDGQWYAAVKLSSPGAEGLQALIEEMALPEGATLTLYEVDVLGARAAVAATYHGSGPLGGDFWTDPVRGDAAILEVLYDKTVAAGLPLHIAEVRGLGGEELAALTAPVTSWSSYGVDGSTGLAQYRGAVVPFQVIDGMAVWEGDILLGPVDQIQLATGKEDSRTAMGISSANNRWAGGIVPYVIDSTLPAQERITNAVAHWNTQLAGTLQLVPRTTQTYYVRFTPAANSTCSSYVGFISMAGQPINVGAYCSTGNVIHEIGHAVGLFHEHTREDRNTYVQIMWDNINTSAVSNFYQQVSISDDLGSYDYGSIMHYPATGFSINGQPTIVTIPAGIPIGQRSALSSGDVNGVRTMYTTTTTTPTTVAITFTSNPTGRTLVIDGTSVTAPRSYNWAPGSVHTISAPSSVVGNTRYYFASWSDGGTQTHSITVPTTARTYTATYSVQHRVAAVSSNSSLGTVALSPTSADGYYNQGTSIAVSASPIGSACLTGWTGITAPASSPVQFSASQPYDIAGSFQTGAVTVSPTTVTVPWTGGTYTLYVTASTGCSWAATSTASWIQFGARSGTGSGTVTFGVPRRNAKSSRTGTIVVGNTTITITQTAR